MSKNNFDDNLEFVETRIAKALNIIEAANERLSFIFEQNPGWYNGVQFQIEDAVVKLGFALATLHNWDDEESNEESECSNEQPQISKCLKYTQCILPTCISKSNNKGE